MKITLNWPLVLIISIFFGVLGIDRFIMRQPLLGILKLITAGGFGIWWLIDVILIASKYPFENIEWIDPLISIDNVDHPNTIDSIFTLSPPKTSTVDISTSSKINNLNNTKPIKINWLFLLIISIFFGVLGFDRFIMRQFGLGLLKLFTGGGFGIWWFIDIILIATKYDFDNVEWV